jgi:hypothetical protein
MALPHRSQLQLPDISVCALFSAVRKETSEYGTGPNLTSSSRGINKPVTCEECIIGLLTRLAERALYYCTQISVFLSRGAAFEEERVQRTVLSGEQADPDRRLVMYFFLLWNRVVS